QTIIFALSPQILTASAADSCYANPQDLEKWQMFFSAQCACSCEFLTTYPTLQSARCNYKMD
ncbi:hypothetical protein ATANTOWER_022213, partial [Ataeniobius toweri]|nr:hypothetical protein [Ataeniobius toweri]